MKNAIFYFSATGNSLVIARSIADKMGDTELISIPKAINEDTIELEYERIGFVFPVFYAFAPSIVKRFINKLSFSKSQYIYAVATLGASYGMTFTDFGECITARGGELKAAFPVHMPGNYIVKYGAFPKVLQKLYFRWAKKKVLKISGLVGKKTATPTPKGSWLLRHYADSSRETINNFGKMAENYHTSEKCNGCGSCARVCPVGNITMKDKKPVWGNACELCVACIQWCPEKAIDYGQKTQKRGRYHHPEIKLSEITKGGHL
ncbi:MAG: EFR1 family ferrodoxin [Bacillota bacterium]|nr:EFR1 family ferrodoxin [Bacillota bacterium]